MSQKHRSATAKRGMVSDILKVAKAGFAGQARCLEVERLYRIQSPRFGAGNNIVTMIGE